MSVKGDQLELRASTEAHKIGIPLLVSSLILRELGAGQVDIARIEGTKKGKSITIIEVKAKWGPGVVQWRRLKKAAIFLSEILHCSSRIQVWTL